MSEQELNNSQSNFDNLPLADRDAFEAGYISMDSDGYETIRQERIAHGMTRVYTVEYNGAQLTLVAAINPGADGSGLDGHDHDPGSRNMTAVTETMAGYISQTPPNARRLIYEGDPLNFTEYPQTNGRYDTADNLRRSITDRSESGAVQLIAASSGIGMESGEPDDWVVASELVGRFSEDQVLAHRVMRGLTFELRTAQEQDRSPALWSVIWLQATKLGIDGFRELDEADKQAYSADPTRMQDEIITPCLDRVDGINQAVGDTVLTAANSDVQLAGKYDGMDVDELYQALMQDVWGADPRDRRPLTPVVEAEMILRDQSIYAKIVRVTREDKSPLVIYGGSHIESLRPVLGC